MQLCHVRGQSDFMDDIKSTTLVALLHLLESRLAFSNVFLRHHLFCILQVIAGRTPALIGVPIEKTLHMERADFAVNQERIFIHSCGCKALSTLCRYCKPLARRLGNPRDF